MRNLKFFAGFAVVVGVVLAVAFVYVLWTQQPPKVPKKLPPDKRQGFSQQKERERSVPERPDTTVAPYPETRKVAIIIDDIGYDLAPIEQLLAIDAPITFAILPHCIHSADAALAIHRAGKEALIHLPMEPHGYPEQNPGAGALFLSMNDDEIRHRVEEDLASVPYCVGMNNHMGSLFMENDAKLSVVLQQLKARGLFFIDSRTTQHSKGEESAARLGLAFASRKVFIDNGRTYGGAFQNLLSTEKSNMPVLMIGHPYKSTIRALREAVPVMKARGIEIVSASELTEPARTKRP